jgi:hypothetical protein
VTGDSNGLDRTEITSDIRKGVIAGHGWRSMRMIPFSKIGGGGSKGNRKNSDGSLAQPAFIRAS